MLSKKDLCRHLADHFTHDEKTLTQGEAAEFLAELAAVAADQLIAGADFTLPGIAKLTVQKRSARTGRNPATGKTVEIPAKNVVKARIAKTLQDTVQKVVDRDESRS